MLADQFWQDDPYGPYVTRERDVWAELSNPLVAKFPPDILDRVRSLGDPIDLAVVKEVYLPLTELIRLYIEHKGELYGTTHDYLRLKERRTPFVIGVAGSVAVGKSTTSRLLRELLSQGPGNPKVDLITTDGFLYPNHELIRRGLLNRKGFPESYDQYALLRFIMDVKSGADRVEAPEYSHLIYDIVPDSRRVIEHPDILIVEGLNVLQPARRRPDGTNALAVSDFFDFSVYVDASVGSLRRWYVDRFLELRKTAFQNPDSYFAKYTELTDQEAHDLAGNIWDTINGPNLQINIKPTRGRATAILRKGRNHDITWIRIRKV